MTPRRRRALPPDRHFAGGGVHSDRPARLARAAKIEGFIEIDGERHRVRKFERGRLSITLYEAANREPSDQDFSQLRATYDGKKTLEIQWNDAGSFKVVKIEAGEWEKALLID